MTSAVLDNTKIATVAGSITVYNFYAQTGEFTGSSDEYLAVGIGLPAHSTDIDPGIAGDGYVMVFTEQAWSRMEDHRGEKVYSTIDRSASVIDYIGAVKDGFTSISPSTPYDKWDGTKWVTDEEAHHAAAVEDAEQQKTALLLEAQETIRLWQTELQLGIISDEDKAILIAWIGYIKSVQATDTSTAPDIDWPVSPQ